jgi:cytochrome b involved in lipid metabolism
MNWNKVMSSCLFAFVCVFISYTIFGPGIKESARTVWANGMWSEKQDVLGASVVRPARRTIDGGTPAVTKKRGYTIGDVRRHNSKPSCWSVVNGTVYDFTSLMHTHPGGQESIFSLCGKDGTEAFLKAHADDRKIMGELADYRIGDLIE